jgi:phosphatidylserine decarboxylase
MMYMKSFDFKNYVTYSPETLFFLFILLLLCCGKYYFTSIGLLSFCLFFILYFYRGKSYSLKFYPFYQNFISSPAEGKVLQIKILQHQHVCISIFLNLSNVHVQYAPCDGTIEQIHYHKGTFHPAFILEKSSYNERQIYSIRTQKWDTIYVSQIAGLFARRIVSFVKENQQVKQGQALGLIKFGSRVDIIVPCQYIKRIIVSKNKNVYIDQPIIEML